MTVPEETLRRVPGTLDALERASKFLWLRTGDADHGAAIMSGRSDLAALAAELRAVRADNERLRGTLVGIRLLHLSDDPSWESLFGEAQERIAAALAEDALTDSAAPREDA